MMDVCIVIPTYNEAANIDALIAAVHDAVADWEHTILVVDDDSPDGTGDHVRTLQETDDRLQLLAREKKQGLGSAYKDAFQQVNADIVVQMDADFSHRPTDLPRLITAVEHDADVAVGSRYVQGGERNDPVHRRIFPLVGSYLYRVLLRSPVRDVTSGFKAYDATVLETLPDDLPDGFHFQAASLLSLVGNGMAVVEVPITFQERRAGTPKYGVTDLIYNAVLLLRLTARAWLPGLKRYKAG